MRILLVEDSTELANEIAWRINRAGFALDHVDTVESASLVLDDCPYSVAILDRRLPDGDGLSLIPRIREKQPTSRILVLTALDAIDNRIEGLDAGADDYLTKPFDLDEMMARVRAVLRRTGDSRRPAVEIGALSFDLDTREVLIAHNPIPLLRRELLLLEALVRRVNCVVPRETLLSSIYGFGTEVQDHALTALVSRLRTRLSEIDSGVEIHSARGLGYMITKAKGRK